MHGDCDLLISRNDSNMFPTKLFNDKISQRIGSLVDHIEYTKEDKAIIKESNALSSLVMAKANLPPPKTTDSGVITPREREKHKQRVLELL